MAEEATEATPTEEEPKAGGGGGGLKTIIVVALVMILEGAAIGLTMWLTGGPNEVSAVGLEGDEAAALDKPVEMLVVKDRFPNLRTGRHFLYDTEVYIKLKTRHKEDVAADLEGMQAQIKTSVATLIRKAEPQWFQEATLATLRRQIKGILDEQFGEDAEGEPIIMEVLITKCIPFRADF